ncbi:MAG: N-acetyltransferase [Gammaproteobacteria bacterium]|nr:N-acetyltransferase [Gammaproteobacteria bacterium]
MSVTIIGAITEICAQDWNALVDDTNPFVRHEFLVALERHHCVSQRFGWIPQHIILRNEHNRLIGAVPLYLKDNSYGEFVFDWSWADAHHRNGLEYYPKLVAAMPYTPATGPRLLIHPDVPTHQTAAVLINTAIAHAKHLKVSSLHWLFTNENDTAILQTQGLMSRLGCQFHWDNQGYTSFDEFLSTFTAAKRKKIKRERRHVSEAGIRFEILNGHEISDSQWSVYYRYYASTFTKLGGYATLSEGFFRELGQNMADNIVLVMAIHNTKTIAAAFSLRGKNTLYGRHWGCEHEYNSLHFEACYYQGIEYCIKHNLQRFEPGAQGEHKISRGFLPKATYSTHWIANTTFRQVISDFLNHETKKMHAYINDLRRHSPYKTEIC